MKNNKITVTVLCSFQNCAHSLSGKVMTVRLKNFSFCTYSFLDPGDH